MRRICALLLLVPCLGFGQVSPTPPPGVIGYRVYRPNRDPIDVASCEQVGSVYRVVHKDGHASDLYESTVLSVEPITAGNARSREQIDDEALTRDAPPGNPLGYLVHLADGRTFNAGSYWRDGAYYAFKSKGGPERHYRASIRRIEGVDAAKQEAQALATRLAFEAEERRRADLKAEYAASIARTTGREQARVKARTDARSAAADGVGSSAGLASSGLGSGLGGAAGYSGYSGGSSRSSGSPRSTGGYYRGTRQPSGHYAGGSGSSHKGGHYTNSATGNHYQKRH